MKFVPHEQSMTNRMNKHTHSCCCRYYSCKTGAQNTLKTQSLPRKGHGASNRRAPTQHPRPAIHKTLDDLDVVFNDLHVALDDVRGRTHSDEGEDFRRGGRAYCGEVVQK